MPLPLPLPVVPALCAPFVARDLSTPEKTLATLCEAFGNRDSALMASCFAAVPKPEHLAKMLKEIPESTKVRLEVAESKIVAQSETEAKVTIRLRATVDPAPPQPIELSPEETVTLRKTGSDWKVVAPATRPANAFVNTIAFNTAHPDGPEPTGVPATRVLSTVKQLALGCLMVCQDWDEVFKIPANGFKKAVLPYVKSADLFRSPLDKPGVESLRFNPALSNVALAKVKKPAQTVMIYEGEPGKPRFRYDGKAVIGFVDGHVKLVTPAEAKKLLWKP